MAAPMFQNKYLFTLFILILELTAIMVLLPADMARETAREEKKDIIRVMGRESAEEIYSFAKENYEALVIDSGAYNAVYRFFVPTEEQKRASKGMEQLGTREGWFDWVTERIENCCLVFYEFLVRIGTIKVWFPYMLILIVPAIGSGILERKVKQSNFDYSSPLIAKAAFSLMIYGMLAFVMAVFLPVPFSPLMVPLLMMAMCILIGHAIGNIQKRL